MLASRLCRAPFADLSGGGARLYGGRWNRPGLPMIYAAFNAALAVLEVRVHLDLPTEPVPDDYVLITSSMTLMPVPVRTAQIRTDRVCAERNRLTPTRRRPFWLLEQSANSEAAHGPTA